MDNLVKEAQNLFGLRARLDWNDLVQAYKAIGGGAQKKGTLNY